MNAPTHISRTTHAPRETTKAVAAILIANICMSFGPWLVRLSGAAPEVSAFWRVAIGAPILFAATRLARQPMPSLDRALLSTLVVAGLFFAADLAAWHVGILHTRMANATLFGNLSSFFFPVCGFVAARTWPSRRQSIAMLVALAGVILLAGRSYQLAGRNLLGDLMCLVAALTYTVYLLVIRRARETLPAMPLITLATAACVPPLLLLALASGRPVMPLSWTPLVLLAIGNQCLGQGGIAYALGRLPPLVVGLTLMIQPILGSAIGWIFYGERLTLPDFAGAAMIGTALVLVRLRDRPA